MNKIQALHSFWNGFGIPAFNEKSVPDESDRKTLYGSAFPYLTYEVSTNDFGNSLVQTASLWYRSSGWAEIVAKQLEIENVITRGGKYVHYDDSAFWIGKSNPWAIQMGDESDDMIRRIVLNVNIEFLE